jgi:hypothetical protein
LRMRLRLLLAGTLRLLNASYYVINMRTHATFLRAVCSFAFQISNFNSPLHFI